MIASREMMNSQMVRIRKGVVLLLGVLTFLPFKSSAFSWTERSFFAVAATATAYQFDQSTTNSLQIWDHSDGPTKTTMFVGERYGGLVAPALALLSYPLAELTTSRENIWLRRSKECFYSVIVFNVAAVMLKYSVGRFRPYEGYGPSHFDMFSPDHSSFPSGHTGTAFAFSVALAQTFTSWWVRGPLLGVATLTGISRIYDQKHWLSDTVAGASLGTLAAFWVDDYLYPQDRKDSQRAWSVVPYVGADSSGFSLFALF